MVTDSLKNIDLYYGLSERLDKAFDYLKTTDFTSMEVGKYEIEGTDIYAMVQEYQSKPLSEGKWEAHKKYIDIQYICQGIEQMGYAQIDKMTVSTEYNPDKDVLFLSGEGSFFKVDMNDFAIFMPNDAHMPGISAGDSSKGVRKVVVKILV